MTYIHTDFNQSLGKLKKLVADMETGNLHLVKTTLLFHRVEDSMGMGLAQRIDFLEQNSQS